MRRAAGSTGRDVHHSEEMVCVDCYHTKAGGEMSSLCQNPKCHFYNSYGEPSPPSCDDVFYDNDCHHDASTSFYKEVGHSKKAGAAPPEVRCPFGSDQSSTMWVYQPTNGHLNFQSSGLVPKPRSRSSNFPGGWHDWQKMLNALDEASFNDQSGRYYKSQRPRLRTLPGHREALLRFEADQSIDDNSLTRPIGITDRYNTPEKDQDVEGSVYNSYDNTSGSDSPSSSNSSLLPAVSSVPTTDSSIFDVTCLKLQLSRIDSHGRRAHPTNKVPPESLLMLTPTQPFHYALNRLSQCSETFSRKVFIGGLPPDLDENDIQMFFNQFGSVTVDWPHKNYSKSCYPPKGYAFLLYKNESSVHKLLLSCISERDKHFLYIPTSGLVKRKIEVRPWYIADTVHCSGSSKTINSRKAVFVGGVPRPLKASELAEVITDKFGDIILVIIDSDCDLKYPKGAACVLFVSHDSYIAAISARFMQLTYGSIDKKVEIKPYILDGQMCDECNGTNCNGKPAPFFCGSVMCLQYYCECCWSKVHSSPGRQNHRPLLKDVGDKSKVY